MPRLLALSGPTEALHLLRTLEARDPVVYAHGLRVGTYARSLGDILGLAGPDLDGLEAAAHLHDLGKLGIPPWIVHKADALDPMERVLLRRHPALGAAMLEAHHQPLSLVQAARHHHERWDGRGYPDGLSGLAIPASARIVAVADAFDAMTSARAYRPTWSTAQALEELDRESGAQFWPEAVSAFRQAAKEGWVLRAG